MQKNNTILAINGGSSSIKFAVYDHEKELSKNLYGQITNIGSASPVLTFADYDNPQKQSIPVPATDYPSTISFFIKWLSGQLDFSQVTAIGHRIVHGMQHTEPALVTDHLLKDLKEMIPFDPDHLPDEIRMIETFKESHSGIPQYACFDTAFHRDMPRMARIMPIPRRYDRMGIQRYGFHGLSYTYLMQDLERKEGKAVADGRIILAHLGSGASLAAVSRGKGIDTSMGFTPNAGIPMSTRSGDLDPGVAWFMTKTDGLSPAQFNHVVSHESGLLGVSETSGDMSSLLDLEATDIRAAEAIALFCYQVKKYIGAYAAALGGLDTLVFSAGIGENAPVIRKRICEGLAFLGILLDDLHNDQNAYLISPDSSRVKVHVIPTDEEVVIAGIVSKIISK